MLLAHRKHMCKHSFFAITAFITGNSSVTWLPTVRLVLCLLVVIVLVLIVPVLMDVAVVVSSVGGVVLLIDRGVVGVGVVLVVSSCL